MTYKKEEDWIPLPHIKFKFLEVNVMEKVLFENCVCRIVEFNGKCFVDEIMDGEVINGSVGMDREDVQEYLNDAGFNIQFN